MALFPKLELLSTKRAGSRITIHLRNAGDNALRAREYGSPGYRLIAKWFAGQRHLGDRWLALPHDVVTGGEVTIELEGVNREALTLKLYHALESVPHLESEPWASAELPRV